MDMKSRLVGEDNLRTVFAMFDKDGDGKITASELKQLLGSSEQFKNKPEKFWDDMIKEVDLNGDGEVGRRDQIDYEEFAAMINKLN